MRVRLNLFEEPEILQKKMLEAGGGSFLSIKVAAFDFVEFLINVSECMRTTTKKRNPFFFLLHYAYENLVRYF